MWFQLDEGPFFFEPALYESPDPGPRTSTLLNCSGMTWNSNWDIFQPTMEIPDADVFLSVRNAAVVLLVKITRRLLYFKLEASGKLTVRRPNTFGRTLYLKRRNVDVVMVGLSSACVIVWVNQIWRGCNLSDRAKSKFLCLNHKHISSCYWFRNWNLKYSAGQESKSVRDRASVKRF